MTSVLCLDSVIVLQVRPLTLHKGIESVSFCSNLEEVVKRIEFSAWGGEVHVILLKSCLIGIML